MSKNNDNYDEIVHMLTEMGLVCKGGELIEDALKEKFSTRDINDALRHCDAERNWSWEVCHQREGFINLYDADGELLMCCDTWAITLNEMRLIAKLPTLCELLRDIL
jgi:hypothetical protein